MVCKLDRERMWFTTMSQPELTWIWDNLSWDFGTEDFRTLLFSTDDKRYYTFRGLFHIIKKNCPFPIEVVEDLYPDPVPIPIEVDDQMFNFGEKPITLLPYQCNAIKKMIMLKRGIGDIKTGGGKTEIILAFCRIMLPHLYGKKIIIIVPSQALAMQFMDRALLRGFNSSEISEIHSAADERDTPILIAVVNTMYNAIQNPDHRHAELFDNTEAMLFDEGHHGSSYTWSSVFAKCKNLNYFLVLSGSPFPVKEPWRDFQSMMLLGAAGKVIAQVSYRAIRATGLISEPVIFFKQIGKGKLRSHNPPWNKLYKQYITENEERNKWIVHYCHVMAQRKFSTLIIIKELDHAKRLMMEMPHLRTICIFGSSRGIVRTEYGDIDEIPIDYNVFRSDFEKGAYDVAIISQVGDEGFDMPSLACVILAAGGKSRIKGLQRVGRALRKKHIGPNRSYIIDFWDHTHVYMRSHSKQRKELYEEIEATVLTEEQPFFNMLNEHFTAIEAAKAEGTDGTL